MLQLAVPDTAKTRGFFTRDEAIAAGWTARAVRTQLKRRVWLQLSPGRYVETAVMAELSPDQRHALVALATGFGRNLVIRRESAACVHCLAVVRTPRIVSARNVKEFAARDLTAVHDVTVTTPACTVVDCTRFSTRREGLVVADSALRANRTTPELLAEQLATVPPNAKGSTAAAFVVAEADARAETAIESVSRYEFISAGLPRPKLQVWVGNKRLDFLWEKYGVIGEADGLGKYGTTDAEVRANLRAERERQRELEAAGYIFVRWMWDEIWYRPHIVLAELLRRLEQRGYRAS
jgi:very-short-patch-repair endonuclease